jgi:hypothetical protein
MNKIYYILVNKMKKSKVYKMRSLKKYFQIKLSMNNTFNYFNQMNNNYKFTKNN